MLSGSSSVMILILRSYINHVSIPCSWSMSRTLLFTPCIALYMFPKPIPLGISALPLRVLLKNVEKIKFCDLNLHLAKQDTW